MDVEMNAGIIAPVIGVLGIVIGYIVSYFLFRKKTNAEIESLELNNIKSLLDIATKSAEFAAKQLEAVKPEIDRLVNINSDLLHQNTSLIQQNALLIRENEDLRVIVRRQEDNEKRHLEDKAIMSAKIKELESQMKLVVQKN